MHIAIRDVLNMHERAVMFACSTSTILKQRTHCVAFSDNSNDHESTQSVARENVLKSVYCLISKRGS